MKQQPPWTVLSQHPEFFKLWLGQTISTFGSAITRLALPLTAVVLLKATPAQMGVLGAVGFVPHLLLGFVVGVWVDRLPRRPLLILADLGQGLLLGSIPLLAVLGALQMEALYIVAFLTGVLALFFDVAATSYVPALVGRADLLQANSADALSQSVASVAGPALAGQLVQLLTAPIAIALDALSFVLSALFSSRIRTVEPAPPPRRERQGMRAEIGEGLRQTVGDPILRTMVGTASLGSLGGAMQDAILVLYLVRVLGLPPTVLGVVFAAQGIAALLGTVFVGPIRARLGPGPSLIAGTTVWTLAMLLLPLVNQSLVVAVPLLLAAQVLKGIGSLIVRVNQLTVRQELVPDYLLGRVNASRRVLVFGVIPLGSLLGGLLGQTIGLRTTLVIGACIMVLSLLWLARSPVRTFHQAGTPQAMSDGLP
jgi:MFS family permease